MVDLHQIERYWGKRLHPIHAQHLRGFSMPSTSRAFLVNMGLPLGADVPFFPFLGRPDLPAVRSIGGRRYLVLAEERAQGLCLEEGTGHVQMIDFKGELPTRFVNSSIEALVQCLQIWKSSGELSAAQLGEELKAVDSDILADEEAFWSVIVEEREADLL